MKEPINDQTIWKYIEGRCSIEAKREIDLRMQLDDQMQSKVEGFRVLHNALKNLPPEKAPEHLIDSTLSRITSTGSYATSSASIWYFLIFMLILSVIAFALPSVDGSYYLPLSIPNGWAPNLSVDWSIPSGSGQYIFVFLVLPVFYFIDRFVGKYLVLVHH